MTNMLDENLESYFISMSARMPNGCIQILEALDSGNLVLNMDQISIESRINRSSIPSLLSPLEVIGLVTMTKHGQAKQYEITERGKEFIKLIKSEGLKNECPRQ